MRRNNWVRLDNASKIFLATMTSTDTKVFRLSAAVRDQVDPDILQRALNETYDCFSLYHSVLRRGIFWYYLEDSDLKPKVQPDNQPACSQIYHYDMKNLLFQVLYYQNRIHLEVFHVLSDGTGALWFLENLLYNYTVHRYPEDFQDEILNYQVKGSQKQQLDDSFARYFGYEGERFANPARATVDTVARVGKAVGQAAFLVGEKAKGVASDSAARIKGKQKERVYHVRGTKTPDNRMRVVEVDMPVDEVMRLSHEAGTSLTVYLTALFIDAVYKDAPRQKELYTIAVSVPVNLRSHFKSSSARNFFSVMRVHYTYGQNRTECDSIESICHSLDGQFKEQMTQEKLTKKLNQLRAYEENPLIRIVIRPLKDVILRIANANSNRTLTLAISNMGRVAFPKDIDPYINQLYAQISAARPQFTSISHGDRLTVCFTSPFVETEIQKNFICMLTEKGVPVRVAVNRVSFEEKPKKWKEGV